MPTRRRRGTVAAKRTLRDRTRSLAGKCLLLFLSAALCLLFAEVVFRVIDGYRLWSLLLERPDHSDDRPSAETADPVLELAVRHMKAYPVANGVDRAWFFDSPPPLPRTKPLPEMRRRYVASGRGSREAIYVFNRGYAIERVCRGEFLFDPWLGDSVPDRFVFEPTPDPSRQYRYRLPSGQTTPDGYVVNRWGFRGPDIPLSRPKGTVRIAFAGASTTINAPTFAYSYPEFIGHWLNRWAEARDLKIRFDIINAGRLGFRSDEIAALIRYEVLPFDPDLVVYYEGSNQFRPNRYVKYGPGYRPTRPLFTLPLESWIEQRSALARRVGAVRWITEPGAEPPKRMGRVEWPAEVDEFDPDLSKRALFPSKLGQILDDLDYLRKHIVANGGELIISTFIWMVKDGMVLKLPEQQNLYKYLNITFWPYTYSHMRRHADFQNRVLATYAREQGIELLDIDRDFPRETALFNDGVHMHEPGIRLRAWMTAQLLIPMIEKRLNDGRLPRRARAKPLEKHPVLSVPPKLMTIAEIRSKCP